MAFDSQACKRLEVRRNEIFSNRIDRNGGAVVLAWRRESWWNSLANAKSMPSLRDSHHLLRGRVQAFTRLAIECHGSAVPDAPPFWMLHRSGSFAVPEASPLWMLHRFGLGCFLLLVAPLPWADLSSPHSGL
jgi:hypothetical protein